LISSVFVFKPPNGVDEIPNNVNDVAILLSTIFAASHSTV
jgi:hypothetical protein